MVKFGVITSGYHWYISVIPVVSNGISVVYHWKSAVKFSGITSGFQWYYQWYTGGKLLEISGKIWWYYHCFALV